MCSISTQPTGTSLEVADDQAILEPVAAFAQPDPRASPQAYEQFRANPGHPGLHFKRVSDEEPLYSVRIGSDHRALGLLKGDTTTWFWIGAHDIYERVLEE